MEIICFSNEKPKAPNYKDLAQHMLTYLKRLDCNMSVKLHYLMDKEKNSTKKCTKEE